MAATLITGTIFCKTSQRWSPMPSCRMNSFSCKSRALVSFRAIRSQSSSSAQSQASLDGETERTKKCMQNLAETLVLPSGFLSKLPKDLKVELNDAAFALSSGPLNQECGERVAKVVMGLSRAWEQADTQTTAALAREIPFLQDFLPSDPVSNSALGRRLAAAGRYLASTGQYGNGELQKLSKALLAAGEALCVNNPSPADKPPPINNIRSLKFGDLQLQVTAQRAYVGAAIAFAFGLLSWELTSAIKNVAPDVAQDANNALVIATSLRGTLLVAGYSCTALAAFSMIGLTVLGSQLGSEGKS